MIDDMTARHFGEKAQKDYIRCVTRIRIWRLSLLLQIHRSDEQAVPVGRIGAGTRLQKPRILAFPSPPTKTFTLLGPSART